MPIGGRDRRQVHGAFIGSACLALLLMTACHASTTGANAGTTVPVTPVGTSTTTATATSASPSPSSSALNAAAPRCSHDALSLSGPLDGFGGFLGEHELTFAVRNNGSTNCSLDGIPVVRLYDSQAMPFAYDNAHPGGPFLSMAPARNVVLAPHASAYFQVVKYRCDLGEGPMATLARIVLPNAGGRFAERLTALGSRSIHLCVGQAHDPGNVVSVSPIRTTGAELGS